MIKQIKIRTQIIVFLLFIALINTQAQELKKVKNKINSLIIEEYYVLKSDNKIKHGKYIKSTKKGKKIEEGYYKLNKKDSIWNFYDYNGKKPIKFGKFDNGVASGKWTFKDYKGRTTYIFDYDKNEIIEYNWNDESNKFPVLKGDEWIEEDVDSPPILMGLEHPRRIIQNNLRYPANAAENGVSGKVVVALIIDSNGKLLDLKIKESIDPDLDAESLRVAKTLGDEWFPAKKNGESLTIEYYIPFTFKIL